MVRYNTDETEFEVYPNSAWKPLDLENYNYRTTKFRKW